jgi:hypothetical protein
MAVMAPADEVHRVISSAFDRAFYRAIYTDVPDEVSALWHYSVAGWREGRDPAPWFSVEAYLKENPDVLRSGIEPLAHFLTRGRREGREVTASRHARAYLRQVDWSPKRWSPDDVQADWLPSARRTSAPAAPPIPQAEQRAAVASEFDAGFYLAANPDVAAHGMPPLDHFLATGWREGRDPNARFSVRDYLENYPDVMAAGLNPFAHFLIAGRAEGRASRHDLGFQYDLIARMKPVEARLNEAVAASRAFRPQEATALAAGLRTAKTGLAELHVTVSHDNYAESYGGVQLCLRLESARFAELGRDHLHLYPAAPWPMVRGPDEPGPLGVLLNGAHLGVFSPQTVRAVLAEAMARAQAGRRSFAIHSLLGHEPEATADILGAAGLHEGFFWLHDFASLCAGSHLLRNDVEDCAAPPPDSAACGVCAYGPWRRRHLDAHRRLFERMAITVVAPSEATLAFWRASWDFPVRDAVVLPHARLLARNPVRASPKDRPLRVAFLGLPTPLKGWPIFRSLAQHHADDPRYEFLHLGGRPDPAAPAAFHQVVGTQARPKAMQETLEAVEADAALIWSLARETFSFTAYEAAAAGAAVITGPDSGNVAAFVEETGLGLVMASEAALTAAFASGEILALSRARRKARRYDLAYSGMTSDLVGRP